MCEAVWSVDLLGSNVRERTLEHELQMRIMRHCDEYFSIVRRSPACACLPTRIT